MLIKSNLVFDDAVLKSADYLNDPTFILNETCDSIYRQFHNQLDEAVKHITLYLKKHKFESPGTKAKDFVEWRKTIKYQEFHALNTNPYLDKVPEEVKTKDEIVNNWVRANTTEKWRYGYLIEQNIPSYPFKPHW
jgi:hypothetical protein